MNTFDDAYFRGLCNNHTGYSTTTVIQLIQYLYDNYRVITAEELANNDEKMKSPYDASKPIETPFGQIEDAMEYADTGRASYILE